MPQRRYTPPRRDRLSVAAIPRRSRSYEVRFCLLHDRAKPRLVYPMSTLRGITRGATIAILAFRLAIANNPHLCSDHFAVPRRRPRNTKIAPAVRFSHCATVSLLRNRLLKLDANQARTRHQIVPVVMNVSPRVMNAAIFMLDAGSINCGRKARKNNATFGLRTFVKTP